MENYLIKQVKILTDKVAELEKKVNVLEKQREPVKVQAQNIKLTKINNKDLIDKLIIFDQNI